MATGNDHFYIHGTLIICHKAGKKINKKETYPELASKHDNFPSGLFFAEAPLNQVLPTLPWQAHVASGYSRVGSACQDVRLCLVVGVHPVGIGNPQRVVKSHLIAASTLVY